MLGDEVKTEIVKRAAGVDGLENGSCEVLFGFVFGRENVENWRMKMAIIGSMFSVMVIGALIDVATGGTFHQNGIYPRRTDGLFGIVLAPFLHQTISQLIINAVPFIILGSFVIMRHDGIRVFGTLCTVVIICGGLIVWILGEETVHVGSYTFVFAFFSYLLLYGALVREWRSTGIALLTFIVYGTTLLSMFSQAVGPQNELGLGAQPLSSLYMLTGLGSGIVCAMMDYKCLQTGISVLEHMKRRFITSKEDGTPSEKASLKDSSHDDEA